MCGWCLEVGILEVNWDSMTICRWSAHDGISAFVRGGRET
jgi:hypothetical protein